MYWNESLTVAWLSTARILRAASILVSEQRPYRAPDEGKEATALHGISDSAVIMDIVSRAKAMKRTTVIYLTFLVLTGAAGAPAARSQAVTHTTRATYDLAHPGNHVIDFDNFGPVGTFYPVALIAPSPLGDIAFQPFAPDRLEILNASSFGFAAGTDNLVLFAVDTAFNEPGIRIILPANTFSFGTDLISPSQTVPEAYQFTLFSGANVLNTLTPVGVPGDYTFIGYDSDTLPITSIEVQINGAIGNGGPVLDNFTVVPEPSAIGLIGFGAAAFLFLRNRRRAGKL